MVEKKRTLIVGGGIIGAATAFFIARHPKFDPENHEIFIIEAVSPACAASGKAGGLLSKTAFPQSLGSLSFRLHEQLAKEFGGAEKWGYRKMSTVSIEGTDHDNGFPPRRGENLPQLGGAATGSAPNGTGSNSASSSPNSAANSVEPARKNLPSELNWLRPNVVQFVDELGGPNEFAQVHPFYFTNFILEHVRKQGILRIIIGRVTQLMSNKSGECSGVTYVSSEGDILQMDADHVVIAAGPWTSALLKDCPIVGMKVPSITVRPTEKVSAFALFTELDLADAGRVSPEIYARPDEIYICGESIDDPLPMTADQITVDESYSEALFSYGSALSEKIAGGEIKVRQACYLPVVDSPYTSGPFVGKTNVPRLLLAAGHTCWGINNAPATGLLLAETLFEGHAHTSNIRGLTPAAFFDAKNAMTESS